MKNIINYVMFMFLMLILSVNTVSAQSIKVSCPDKAKPGSSFTCSITADYDKEYGGLDANFNLSSGLSLSSFSRDSKFGLGDMVNNNLVANADDKLIGSVNVGTFVVMVKETVKDTQTISFTNVKIRDVNFNSITCPDVSVSIEIDNTVEEEPKEEEPKPNGGDTNNKPSTNNNNNNNSKPSTGNSSTNNKKVSTKINSIKLSSGKIEFNKDVNEYEMDVANEVTDISVDVELEDKNSGVSITGNNGLVLGVNVISITVTGSDGSTNIYTIKVNRIDNDSLLASLKVKGYEIDFDSYKFEYNIELKNNYEGLQIEAIPVSDKATVVIEGNKGLHNGKEIKIVVKAEEGNTSTYVLKIVGLASMRLIFGMIGAVVLTIIVSMLAIIIIKNRNKKIENMQG